MYFSIPQKSPHFWPGFREARHSALVMVFSILNEERLKWQKVRMKAEDIAWIEEASKALEQEPIKLEFLEEVLVA